MSFLSLLSTVNYGPNGIIIPNGYIQTISSNGAAEWTSTLGLATGLSVSTLRGSTLLTSEASVQSVGYSTLTGSTLYGNSGTISTLRGSTLTTGSVAVSTLLGSTVTTHLISAPKVSLTSTVVALGQSTTQTQTNFSQGSYAAESWITAKSSMANVRKVAMSSSGQYQIIVSGGTNDLWLSSDSGVTWAGLTTASCGLPTLTGSSYWSSGSISASGQQIILAIYGGSLWMSNDYGRTFSLTNQPTPDIWLQLNGDTNDAMGGPAATATGSPGYVSVQQPGFTDQAINLANTAGGTATRYLTRSWTPSANFTISFWMNPQTLGVTQVIFGTNGINVPSIQFNTSIQPYIPSGGGSNYVAMGASSALSVNTWYYVTIIFQTNGLCSFYLNNNLISSVTNSQGFGTISPTSFFIGSDAGATSAFNGYIADLRIYNSAAPYVPIPLLAPNIWLPFENNTMDCGSQSANSAGSTIYCPFEGSVADQMGVSTVTATGSPGYVAANREGYTGQAINLVNTAGGTATQYVDGTWAGATNFSVSFWMNPQSTTGVYQYAFSSYTSFLAVGLSDTNNLFAICPSGGGSNYVSIGTTSFTASVNTWYYITVIFQTNGLCSFYVNNALIGSITNSQGVGSIVPTVFSLGGIDGSHFAAFNGYIDDFRLYNYAITYNPVSIMTVTGSLSYVPGVVGLNAVSLANTLDPALATNYIRGTIQSGQTYTLSGWCNFQSLPTSGFSAVAMLGTATTNELGVYFQFGNGLRFLYGNSIIYTQSSVPLNTWFHFHFMNQTNGLSVLHINGIQVASIAITTLNNLPTILSLGCNAPNTGASFNGYIDDFRLYNAAIPFAPTTSTILPPPQNYRSVALSGTGQYALASAASGWVVGSSTSGQTWSKQSVCVGTQGDVIQPNLTGLAQAQWSQNGVNWVATASSTLSNSFPVYGAFDRLVGDAGQQWNSNATYSASGTYTGSVSTTVLGGVGSVPGEWIQLQGNTPLTISSFSITSGGWWQNAKTYYVVGSNDGTNWYPIQYGVFSSNPYNTNYTAATTNVLINFTGAQTYIANTSVTLTTTSYSTTTTPYLYFRFIAPSIFNQNIVTDSFSIGELSLNFTKPSPSALSLSYSGQYQLVATNPAAGSIMPNQTNLASSTWTQGGVQWGVSASTTFSESFPIYYAFDNTGSNRWASAGTYNSSGVYTGSVSTSIQTIGSIPGEWIQIQASVPLVFSSYTLGAGYTASQMAKGFYFAGSMDGSTWYPVHQCQFTVNPFTANVTYTIGKNYITVNYTGTQTLTADVAGSGTTTSYSYSTQPWMYIRMIINTVWPTGGTPAVELGELYLNFSNSVSYSSNYGSTWSNTATTMSNEIVSLSPSGQYALSTNTVAPLARLLFDNTAVDAQGALALATQPSGTSAPTYSSSIVKVGTHSAYFNQTVGGAPSVVLNYNVPAVLNKPTALTISCWVYPTSLASDCGALIFANTALSGYGPNLYIGSSGIIYANMWTVNGNAQISSGASRIIVNAWSNISVTFAGSTGILYINGVQVGTNTSVAGPLSLNGGNDMNTILIGTVTTSTGAFQGYVDDVRIYTQALSADGIASLYQNPALTQAIGVSSSYLPITSYVKPVLPGATANVVDAKVSQTGQYMVAVTAANTNNVYYSTDSGATFNALSVNGYTQAGATTPLARLPFDNASEDVLGGLTQATGAGTVTYSTSIKKVGTHSAFFNNTAGSTATNYLNYTVPAVLNTPPALTMACWIYPTSYASSNSAFFIGMPGGGGQSGNAGSSLSLSATTGIVNFYSGKTSGSAVGLSSNIAAPLNTWTHVALTFSGGLITIYVNGVSQNTTTIAGNLSNDVGGPMANLIIGCVNGNGSQAYAGYIDDVRLYTSALTATEIAALYAGTYDSLYTVAPMTACAISSDGSYFTVTNSSTTYTLNRNSKGFTLALGSQAGSINQALNSIAIGNKAGQINQSANSIVINATGATLSTGNDGCYVAPIASGSKSSSTALTLLGYGTDSQVVQSGIRVQNTQQIIYGEWIQQQLATPQPISAYAIMNRNGYAIQCPTAWYILGSIDGTNWDLLDYQRNITNTNGAIYSLPSLTPLYSYYRFVISQINRSSSSLTSNVTAFADIGGFVLYKNGSPLFSAPTATNALAPYTLSGPYSNILQSNGNTLSTITFSWLPIGQSFYGIGFDGALGTYNMGLIAVQNGHLNTTAPSGTFLGFYIPVTSFGSGANCEYDTNGIAFQGTSTSITSPSLSLSGTTNIEGTLTVSGGFSATVDLTAQGPYLIPSPENAPIILQWLQKTVATVTPTTGVSPFWGTGLTFSPSIAHGQGDNAFAGGVLLQDGRVVFVPLMSPNVGIFNPHTNTFTAGPAHGQGSNAFYGGCLLPDGRVFFAPLNSLVIGLYNPLTNTFTAGPAHGQGGEGDKYVDPVLLPNGKVMLCPASTPNIGLYDPSTNTFSLGPAHGQGSVSSFAGSKLLPDGRVVMIPQNSSYMGIYDPIKNTFTRGAYAGGGSYVGGVLLHDGRVVCVPLTANIGVYNPYTDTFQVGAAHGQGATSYLGGSLLPDGRVAMAPYGAVNITIYNPVTDRVNIVSGNVGAGYAGCVTLFDGRILFVPRTSSNIGLLHTNVVANRELCLSPYFNNF